MMALVISCSLVVLVTRSTRFWYSTTIVPRVWIWYCRASAGSLFRSMYSTFTLFDR